MALRHLAFFPLDREVPLPALATAGRPEPIDLPQEAITKVPDFYSSTASERTVITLSVFVCCTESPAQPEWESYAASSILRPIHFKKRSIKWHYVGTGLHMLYEFLRNLRAPPAYRKIAPGSGPLQAPTWAIGRQLAALTSLMGQIRPMSINFNLYGTP